MPRPLPCRVDTSSASPILARIGGKVGVEAFPTKEEIIEQHTTEMHALAGRLGSQEVAIVLQQMKTAAVNNNHDAVPECLDLLAFLIPAKKKQAAVEPSPSFLRANGPFVVAKVMQDTS